MNRSLSNFSWRLVGRLLTFSAGIPATKIFLVGDSTMSLKPSRAYPETGWGKPFAAFFDATVRVKNVAQNGRSTKSFIREKHWQRVTDRLAAGDFVLIQFGHNDEVKGNVGRYTTPGEFKSNLQFFVKDTRHKKAVPVLITPVARRKFDSAGHIEDTHGEYASLVKEVATELQVPCIDLNKKSRELLQSIGTENTKYLFNYLKPGEHPNYPSGREDDTHFNGLGARKMADLVLSEIRRLQLPIVKNIV